MPSGIKFDIQMDDTSFVFCYRATGLRSGPIGEIRRTTRDRITLTGLLFLFTASYVAGLPFVRPSEVLDTSWKIPRIIMAEKIFRIRLIEIYSHEK